MLFHHIIPINTMLVSYLWYRCRNDLTVSHIALEFEWQIVLCVLLQKDAWCLSQFPLEFFPQKFKCKITLLLCRNTRRPILWWHIVVYFVKFKGQITLQIFCMALHQTQCIPVSPFWNEYEILCTRIFFLFSQSFCSDRKINSSYNLK